MIKWLFSISILFLLSCGGRSVQNSASSTVETNKGDTNTTKPVFDSIDSSKTNQAIDSEKPIKAKESSLISKEDCGALYRNVKFPVFLIVDMLSNASTTYRYDSASESIKHFDVMPDAPSEDACSGIYVIKQKLDLDPVVMSKIQNEIDRILTKNNGRLKVIYVE